MRRMQQGGQPLLKAYGTENRGLGRWVAAVALGVMAGFVALPVLSGLAWANVPSPPAVHPPNVPRPDLPPPVVPPPNLPPPDAPPPDRTAPQTEPPDTAVPQARPPALEAPALDVQGPQPPGLPGTAGNQPGTGSPPAPQPGIGPGAPAAPPPNAPGLQPPVPGTTPPGAPVTPTPHAGERPWWAPSPETVSQSRTIISKVGNFLGSVVPSVAAYVEGFRLKQSGDYIIATGARYFASKGEKLSFWQRLVMWGRVPGTRYRADNPAVRKYFDPKVAIRNSLDESVNITSKSFWRAARKAGGPVGLALVIGGDLYDYSPWGSHAAEGIASTGFAAAAVVDTGLAVTSGAVSAAAGAWAAGAVAGMVAGSVVPVVGTVAGFLVGLGLTFFLASAPGRRFRNWLHGGVKGALDWVSGKVSSLF